MKKEVFYSQILKDNLDNQTNNMYLQDFTVQHLMLETYNLKLAVACESSGKTETIYQLFCFFCFNYGQRQFLFTVMV